MNQLKPRLSRCPTCGRSGMRRESLDVQVNGRLVRGVQVDTCPHCGERLYDSQAMDMLEAKPSKHRNRVTRKKRDSHSPRKAKVGR